MSLESWKKEFFRTPIPTKTIPAIKHCISKWEGLKAHNLRRHGLLISSGGHELIDNQPSDDDHMAIDADNCALCGMSTATDCGDCPIYAVQHRSCHIAWSEWTRFSYTAAMLKLLRKTLKYWEKKLVKQH